MFLLTYFSDENQIQHCLFKIQLSQYLLFMIVCLIEINSGLFRTCKKVNEPRHEKTNILHTAKTKTQ